MEIEYREIERFPGYRVGSDGSVWSRWEGGRSKRMKDTWHQMSLWLDKRGYRNVRVCRRNYGVHTLVLMAFVGPRPEGMECRHLNGDPSDNTLENLRWGTRSEQYEDKIRHGTATRGSRHYCARLTETDIPEIRRLRSTGLTFKAIGERFGVSPSTIFDVLRKGGWGHVGGPVFEDSRGNNHRGSKNHNARLTESDVLEIRRSYGVREPLKAIAERFGISVANVQAIVYRRTWKHIA